eukprot:14156498-Heterocapsa_arctica.AAC.1
MKGIINFETQPMLSSDFKQTYYSYIVDLVAKSGKKNDKEVGNVALKAAADGPIKGIINFVTPARVTSDFKQADITHSYSSD